MVFGTKIILFPLTSYDYNLNFIIISHWINSLFGLFGQGRLQRRLVMQMPYAITLSEVENGYKSRKPFIQPLTSAPETRRYPIKFKAPNVQSTHDHRHAS